MRLIKQGFEIIEQPSGLEGMYKMIEMAGRTCYKSEDKITETSAKEFVDRMIKSGHGAMLEHGTVYLCIEVPFPKKEVGVVDVNSKEWKLLEKFSTNKYSIGRYKSPSLYSCAKGYITTNLRVLVENGWLDDLKYWCEPTEYHEKRYTVKWTIDRVTGESFLRHRVFSFARESTRYCNYSKDKFGNELTFIIPNWLNLPENNYGTIDNPNDIQFKDYDNPYEAEFINGLLGAEFRYMNLLKKWDDKIPDRRYKTKFKGNPWTPQQARQVLPFSVSSPLVMTGFASDWLHFFDLRCDSHAHPQAREIATALKEEFIKRKYIKE